MIEEFDLKSARVLLSEPLPSDSEESASLAKTAAEILRNDGEDRLDSAAWRLADALVLIASKCPAGTQGVDVFTGRGVRIVIKDEEDAA